MKFSIDTKKKGGFQKEEQKVKDVKVSLHRSTLKEKTNKTNPKSPIDSRT